MIKTIIFDFNGTLLDDLDINYEIFNMLAEDFHADKITMEEYKEVFDFPVKAVYKKWGFDVEGDKFPIIADRFHEYYNSMVFKRCKIFDSALELLKELKGKYNLVCLSASKKETLDKQLKYFNIYDYFDEIVGMTDKFANGKVEMACKWLQESLLNKDEIIFIGDTVHDRLVASCMGVKCILITSGHNSRSRLEKVCDIVIDDIKELKEYLD